MSNPSTPAETGHVIHWGACGEQSAATITTRCGCECSTWDRPLRYTWDRNAVTCVACWAAEVERLTKLAYLGDHHFDDLTYKARLEETVGDLRAEQAAHAKTKTELGANIGVGMYWRDRCKQSEAERDRLAAELTEANACCAHERCHDLVCNGSRAYPRGDTGHGCSCAGRDGAYAEVDRLTKELADQCLISASVMDERCALVTEVERLKSEMEDFECESVRHAADTYRTVVGERDSVERALANEREAHAKTKAELAMVQINARRYAHESDAVASILRDLRAWLTGSPYSLETDVLAWLDQRERESKESI